MLIIILTILAASSSYSQQVEPIGGLNYEEWIIGSTVNVHWTEGYIVGNVKVELIDCYRQCVYVIDSNTSVNSIYYKT
jgi:hypothetical protein